MTFPDTFLEPPFSSADTPCGSFTLTLRLRIPIQPGPEHLEKLYEDGRRAKEHTAPAS
jgi:hypothetical protein